MLVSGSVTTSLQKKTTPPRCGIATDGFAEPKVVPVASGRPSKAPKMSLEVLVSGWVGYGRI